MDQHLLEKGAALILKGLGADTKHDRNYQDTPERFARALVEMFKPPDTEWAVFPQEGSNLIILRDHRLYTLCPHHLLPVKLYVTVAYIPDKNVLGLSKLARVTQLCNSGPLLQEAFTRAVVDKLAEICKGIKGAACLVEGKHGCMEYRGVKSDAHFLTYAMSGEFETNLRLQDRFFALAKTPGR